MARIAPLRLGALGAKPAAPETPGRDVEGLTNHWSRFSVSSSGSYTPSLLEGSAAVRVKDCVYLIGGFGRGRGRCSAVERLHLPSMQWSKVSTRGEAPEPRSGHTASLVGDRIYVVGGESSTSVLQLKHGRRISHAVLDSVFSLDPATGRWERVHHVSDVRPRRRGHTCTVLPDALFEDARSRILLFGGAGPHPDTGTDVHFNDLFAFDPVDGAWTQLPLIGSPPSPRSSHSATLVGERVIVFGGDTTEPAPPDVHVLHVRSMVWSVLPVEEGVLNPPPLAAHRCLVNPGAKEQLVVFGGRGRDGVVSPHLYTLDAEIGVWNREETTGRKPAARYDFAAFSHDGRVCVFGGCARSAGAPAYCNGDVFSVVVEPPEDAGEPPNSALHDKLAEAGIELPDLTQQIAEWKKQRMATRRTKRSTHRTAASGPREGPQRTAVELAVDALGSIREVVPKSYADFRTKATLPRKPDRDARFHAPLPTARSDVVSCLSDDDALANAPENPTGDTVQRPPSPPPDRVTESRRGRTGTASPTPPLAVSASGGERTAATGYASSVAHVQRTAAAAAPARFPAATAAGKSRAAAAARARAADAANRAAAAARAAAVSAADETLRSVLAEHSGPLVRRSTGHLPPSALRESVGLSGEPSRATAAALAASAAAVSEAAAAAAAAAARTGSADSPAGARAAWERYEARRRRAAGLAAAEESGGARAGGQRPSSMRRRQRDRLIQTLPREEAASLGLVQRLVPPSAGPAVAAGARARTAEEDARGPTDEDVERAARATLRRIREEAGGTDADSGPEDGEEDPEMAAAAAAAAARARARAQAEARQEGAPPSPMGSRRGRARRRASGAGSESMRRLSRSAGVRIAYLDAKAARAGAGVGDGGDGGGDAADAKEAASDPAEAVPAQGGVEPDTLTPKSVRFAPDTVVNRWPAEDAPAKPRPVAVGPDTTTTAAAAAAPSPAATDSRAQDSAPPTRSHTPPKRVPGHHSGTAPSPIRVGGPALRTSVREAVAVLSSTDGGSRSRDRATGFAVAAPVCGALPSPVTVVGLPHVAERAVVKTHAGQLAGTRGRTVPAAAAVPFRATRTAARTANLVRRRQRTMQRASAKERARAEKAARLREAARGGGGDSDDEDGTGGEGEGCDNHDDHSGPLDRARDAPDAEGESPPGTAEDEGGASRARRRRRRQQRLLGFSASLPLPDVLPAPRYPKGHPLADDWREDEEEEEAAADERAAGHQALATEPLHPLPVSMDISAHAAGARRRRREAEQLGLALSENDRPQSVHLRRPRQSAKGGRFRARAEEVAAVGTLSRTLRETALTPRAAARAELGPESRLATSPPVRRRLARRDAELQDAGAGGTRRSRARRAAADADAHARQEAEDRAARDEKARTLAQSASAPAVGGGGGGGGGRRSARRSIGSASSRARGRRGRAGSGRVGSGRRDAPARRVSTTADDLSSLMLPRIASMLGYSNTQAAIFSGRRGHAVLAGALQRRGSVSSLFLERTGRDGAADGSPGSVGRSLGTGRRGSEHSSGSDTLRAGSLQHSGPDRMSMSALMLAAGGKDADAQRAAILLQREAAARREKLRSYRSSRSSRQSVARPTHASPFR